MKQITQFWNWFQDNEETIKNTLLLGFNTKEVVIARRNDEAIFHFKRNLNYVSKRIGFLIISPSNNQDKYTIIFTADGNRKLFPKIIALEDQAPHLQHFISQAFIKPIKNKTSYLAGTDNPYIFKKIQNQNKTIIHGISRLQHYNQTTKNKSLYSSL